MADKERIYCVDNKFYKIKVSDEIHTLFLNDHEVLQNYIKQNICASDDNCNKSNKPEFTWDRNSTLLLVEN
ncbi:hypothetical protein QE152_g35304 [Popillia japonica]|uniref:Uncharacterized protein n=1 Tax=Popillia japonica TaxID=7064 RepID=A0AAW1IGB3_POPJA